MGSISLIPHKLMCLNYAFVFPLFLKILNSTSLIGYDLEPNKMSPLSYFCPSPLNN